MAGNIVIGICGGSGSGKSTLARKIKEEFGSRASIVSMDSFYKYQPNTTYEERTRTNYDHPDAFDTDIMIECVKELKSGKDTKIPVYDFTIHNRSSQPWETVKATPVIILDGILLFAFPQLVELMDIKVFVDTDADVRILRRVHRDVIKRGRSVESVIDQYLNTVKPMHEAYVEPYKKLADVIIPEGAHNSVAREMVISLIKERLNKQ
ncbi:MAG: uridine kinase [Clostridia bacterium]|nr:uridine kinase [Clostridia bacterium]